jgi:phage terminase large subunit GpA-like protein
VVPVFGDPKIVQGTLYRIAAAERDAKTGRKVEGGIMAWGIETNAYKSEVSDRWMADRTHPGVWWLPRDILETDGGEDYLRQVTAESRSLEVRNGRKAIVWQLIAHGQANHFFDCETYIAALADMVTGGEWATLDKRAAAIKTKRAAKSKTSQAARQKTGSPQPYGRIRS